MSTKNGKYLLRRKRPALATIQTRLDEEGEMNADGQIIRKQLLPPLEDVQVPDGYTEYDENLDPSLYNYMNFTGNAEDEAWTVHPVSLGS